MVKLLTIVYVEPAVAGPARGDHAACYYLAALGELDSVVAVPPFEADRLLGHRGPGAELVGLDQGAAGQLEARETGGEAQVILYPGASARLPPKAIDSRTRVERPSEAP
jgi:hypothetical protein